MMTLWKIITVFRSSSWNFSSPHYVTYFVRQRLQKFTEKVTSKVPFREISWENIHFCGLKKETFISNGRKIYVNSSKKYVKFFSSGYYFSSYISPLIRINNEYCFDWLIDLYTGSFSNSLMLEYFKLEPINLPWFLSFSFPDPWLEIILHKSSDESSDHSNLEMSTQNQSQVLLSITQYQFLLSSIF